MRARTAVQARGTKCCTRPRNTAQHAQYKPMCEGERCGVDCNGRASKARWPVFRAAARGRRLKSGQRERGYGGWSRPSRTFGADACSQCRGGTPAVFGTRAGCCRLQPRPSWSWIAQMTGSLWCNLSPRSGASRSRRQLFPLSLASWRHPCRTAKRTRKRLTIRPRQPAPCQLCGGALRGGGACFIPLSVSETAIVLRVVILFE